MGNVSRTSFGIWPQDCVRPGSKSGSLGSRKRSGFCPENAQIDCAWLLTLPAAGIVGAVCWFIANGIGGALGVTVIFGVLVFGAAYMFMRSRRTPITPENVNAEWEGGLVPTDEREPAKTAS